MLASLSSKDYRLLWLGQTIALLGDQFHLIAMPWLVLQLTGDPLQLGLVLAAAGTARAASMLFGGVLADRYAPRDIMIWANAVRFAIAGALAGVVLGGAIEMWMVYLAAIAFGVITGIFEPASQAAVPRLVPDEHLESGNSLVFFGDQLANFLGPAAAGALIGWFGTRAGADAVSLTGVGVAFVVHAATFVVSIVLLSLMGRMQGSDVAEESPLRSIAAGVRFLADRPTIKWLLTFVATANFFVVGPLFVGVPVLADTRFAQGPAALGIVLSGFAFGNLIGLVLAGSLRLPSPRVLGAIVVGLFVMFGAALAVFAWVESLFIAVPVMALVGIGNGFLGVTVVTYVQRSTPAEMIGRMMSLLMLAVFATMPLSQALAGAVIKVSIEALFLGAGAGLFLTGMLAATRPEVRSLGAAPAARLAQAGVVAALVLSAGALGIPDHAHAAATPLQPSEIESFLDRTMAEQFASLDIPGASVAIVHDGEIVVAKGWGFADLDQRAPVDPERTLMRPGSASKPITWTAVMQLVEQGIIDLDADINDYLDFEIPATFPQPVTMHHLLTHTAGFEAVEEDLFIVYEDRVPELREYLIDKRPARIFPPGEAVGYSNYGTALAGYIVERVSGEPFHAYVEAHIFAPLGMERSTFRQPVPPAFISDLAQGYGLSDGEHVRGDFEYVGPYPAGSASASTSDMARFMIAHLEGGAYGDARILEPETVELMHRRQFTPDPRLDKMAYGFMEREVNGRELLWHGGSTFLHNSGMYLIPGESVGLYVSYNGHAGAQGRELLLQAFMDEFFPAEQPVAALKPSPESVDRIRRYAGEYHLTRSEFTSGGKIVRLLMAARVSASADGRLLLAIEDVTEPYVELEEGVFRHETRDELLIFETAEDGTVWLHSDGAPSHATLTATSAFRVPWYESLPVTALLLGGGALLFLVSVAAWAIGAVISRRRGDMSGAHVRSAPPARSARWLAIAFALFYLFFLSVLVGVLGDIHPAYGMPGAFLGITPSILTVALWVPIVLVPASLGMIALSWASWRGVGSDGVRYWGPGGRILYTVLAAWSAGIVWALFFWNLTALTA